MGVIHQHRRGSLAAARRQHPFHPPRHAAEAGEGLQQRLERQPLLGQHPDGLQQIHQIEAAHQWRAEGSTAHGSDQGAGHAAGRQGQVVNAQFGGRILQRTAPAGAAGGEQPCGQLLPPGIIDIDHSPSGQQRWCE